MSLPFTDQQARVKIAGLVTTASGSTRVYPWDCLSFRINPNTGKADFTDWIAHCTDSGQIHGWMVRRVGRIPKIRAGCEDFIFEYEVLGLYGFEVGNETTNSDYTFSAIVDSVSAAFNQGSENGVIVINGYAASHEGLVFTDLTTIRSGEKQAHFARGFLEIRGTT